VSGVLLARALGPENYGVYAFVLSIITLLSLPAKAGLPTLLIREVAKSQQNKNWGLMRGLLRAANGFVFSYSIAVAGLAAMFVWWQWSGSESAKINTFLWALWLLPLMAFEAVRTGTLRGLRWIASSQLPEQILRPLVIIALVGLAILLGSDITSVTAIQFNVIGGIFAFVLGAALLVKAFPKEAVEVDAEYILKPWAVSLVPLSLFAGLKMLDSQVSIIFLGFLGTDEQVGLFRVAATGATLVAVGLTSVNMALAPQIARLYNAGEMEKLQRVVTLSTRAVAALSFPVALIFIVWGEEVIAVVFGSQYVPAATALAILAIGQLVNATTGSVALILNMTGNDRATVVAAIYALFLNVILGVSLIPYFGILGAAIGYSVSFVIWNIILLFKVKRKTGINAFMSFN
jgi:O-antigen/teichoic acid export membrane protein